MASGGRRALRAIRHVVVTALLAAGIAGATAVFGAAAPAGACTYGPYQYSVWANNPVRSGSNVSDQGGITEYPSVGCGVTQQTSWLTKACGFWGCSWETQASTQFRAPSSTYYYQYAVKGCRSGLNRYETLSEGRGLGGPSGNYVVDQFSGQPQFAC